MIQRLQCIILFQLLLVARIQLNMHALSFNDLQVFFEDYIMICLGS